MYINIPFYAQILCINIFLKYNSQEISWQHIFNLNEWDLGMKRCNPGL